MNNSNIPANANSINLDEAMALGCDGSVKEFAKIQCGLTKREYAAIEAMKGLLSSGYYDLPQHRVEDVTNAAIEHADALLETLERTEEDV